MFRTTTLLIVIVLAAAPTTSLACELWCTSPAVQDHHRVVGCHQGSHIAFEQQLGAASKCDDAAAITPFLTEARQTQTSPLSELAPVSHISAVFTALNGHSEGWAVCQLLPAGSPPLHTILRI
jgi:hypothetical protein